jgi:hypothetical protein
LAGADSAAVGGVAIARFSTFSDQRTTATT